MGLRAVIWVREDTEEGGHYEYLPLRARTADDGYDEAVQLADRRYGEHAYDLVDVELGGEE